MISTVIRLSIRYPGVVVALADYRAAFVVAGIGAAAGLALVGPVARRAAASARSTG